MGPVDFIASLGGLFGLCLGFSIISFIEIIYWAATGIFRNVFAKQAKSNKVGILTQQRSDPMKSDLFNVMFTYDK